MNTIKLSCTDAELSAAVALAYGWQRRIADRDHPVDHGGMRLPNHFSNDPIEAWTCDGDPLNTGVYGYPPRFATSADSLIPLLEKFPGVLSDFESHQGPNKKWKVAIMISNENFVVDYGTTFARAACFALLRVAGVEIVP